MGKKGKSRKQDGVRHGDSGFGYSPYLQQKGMGYTPDKTAEARKVRKEARDEIEDALEDMENFEDLLFDDDSSDEDYFEDDYTEDE